MTRPSLQERDAALCALLQQCACVGQQLEAAAPSARPCGCRPPRGEWHPPRECCLSSGAPKWGLPSKAESAWPKTECGIRNAHLPVRVRRTSRTHPATPCRTAKVVDSERPVRGLRRPPLEDSCGGAVAWDRLRRAVSRLHVAEQLLLQACKQEVCASRARHSFLYSTGSSSSFGSAAGGKMNWLLLATCRYLHGAARILEERQTSFARRFRLQKSDNFLSVVVSLQRGGSGSSAHRSCSGETHRSDRERGPRLR